MAWTQSRLFAGHTALGVRIDTREALQVIRAKAREIDHAQRRIFAAHREAGDLAAEQFAQVLEEKVQARAARTGFAPRESAHLRKALRDPRNAPVGASQIGAGNPAWLDRSAARLYWRNLDQGTAQFVGTPVFVFPRQASAVETGIRDARNSRWRGTATVERPIQAYNFMEEGAKRAERVLAGQMRSIYRRHIPNFYALFTEVQGAAPTMSGRVPPRGRR